MGEGIALIMIIVNIIIILLLIMIMAIIKVKLCVLDIDFFSIFKVTSLVPPVLARLYNQ